jgi:hypothetical protein
MKYVRAIVPTSGMSRDKISNRDFPSSSWRANAPKVCKQYV